MALQLASNASESDSNSNSNRGAAGEKMTARQGRGRFKVELCEGQRGKVKESTNRRGNTRTNEWMVDGMGWIISRGSLVMGRRFQAGPGWLAGQASGLDKGEITSRPFVGTAGEVREDWRNQRAND